MHETKQCIFTSLSPFSSVCSRRYHKLKPGVCKRIESVSEKLCLGLCLGNLLFQ